jgi:hypothetical protein
MKLHITRYVKNYYRRTSLYLRDKERKIWFTNNGFAYKKTKDDYKLDDSQLHIEDRI